MTYSRLPAKHTLNAGPEPCMARREAVMPPFFMSSPNPVCTLWTSPRRQGQNSPMVHATRAQTKGCNLYVSSLLGAGYAGRRRDEEYEQYFITHRPHSTRPPLASASALLTGGGRGTARPSRSEGRARSAVCCMRWAPRPYPPDVVLVPYPTFGYPVQRFPSGATRCKSMEKFY